MSNAFAKHRKKINLIQWARLLSSDISEKRMTLITSLNVHEVFLQWYGITASALLSRVLRDRQLFEALYQLYQ